jgi:hypothetical protein
MRAGCFAPQRYQAAEGPVFKQPRGGATGINHAFHMQKATQSVTLRI